MGETETEEKRDRQADIQKTQNQSYLYIQTKIIHQTDKQTDRHRNRGRNRETCTCREIIYVYACMSVFA